MLIEIRSLDRHWGSSNWC